MSLSIGSLFSGIGGLELGMEMTGGFHTLWQAEQNPYALHVLARHWPHAERFTDVRLINSTTVPRVDVLTGGFPCQPHSIAGKRGDSSDERDLWAEFARIIGDLRPRWVVAENTPGLLSSHDSAFQRNYGGAFFGRVLSSLAEIGFDAEWHCFPASAVGASHERQRVFIVAYPHGMRELQPEGCEQDQRRRAGDGRQEMGHAESGRRDEGERDAPWSGRHPAVTGGSSGRHGGQEHFPPEPDVGRVADGVPARMERLERLGNAVVPQCAAVIGRAITEAEAHLGAFGVMPEQIVQRRHLVPA